LNESKNEFTKANPGAKSSTLAAIAILGVSVNPYIFDNPEIIVATKAVIPKTIIITNLLFDNSCLVNIAIPEAKKVTTSDIKSPPCKYAKDAQLRATIRTTSHLL
jgi:hypothetical protein